MKKGYSLCLFLKSCLLWFGIELITAETEGLMHIYPLTMYTILFPLALSCSSCSIVIVTVCISSCSMEVTAAFDMLTAVGMCDRCPSAVDFIFASWVDIVARVSRPLLLVAGDVFKVRRYRLLLDVCLCISQALPAQWNSFRIPRIFKYTPGLQVEM